MGHVVFVGVCFQNEGKLNGEIKGKYSEKRNLVFVNVGIDKDGHDRVILDVRCCLKFLRCGLGADGCIFATNDGDNIARCAMLWFDDALLDTNNGENKAKT